MNNKGFAITGILYTIFILFIMVLLSILAGLSSRRSLLEKSMMSLEDDYKITDANMNNITGTTAPFTGKYIYKRINSETECTTYLKKGVSLDKNSVIFIEGDEGDCNSDKNDLVVATGYKFNNGEE